MSSRMHAGRSWAMAAVCALVMVLAASPSRGGPDAATLAKEAVDRSGVKGGLVVCVGGDGQFLAELGRTGRFLVHGLCADATKAGAIRKDLAAAGLAGIVSVEAAAPPKLPYADNLAALLVAPDAAEVDVAEVMRVLRPLGVARLGVKRGAVQDVVAKVTAAGVKDARLEKGSRLCMVLTKPRPAGMD
ncbi:MAG: hypothetical protein ACYS5V_16510, partial [Planctomycetota bacterium]